MEATCEFSKQVKQNIFIPMDHTSMNHQCKIFNPSITATDATVFYLLPQKLVIVTKHAQLKIRVILEHVTAKDIKVRIFTISAYPQNSKTLQFDNQLIAFAS